MRGDNLTHFASAWRRPSDGVTAMSISQEFDRAFRLHQQGKLREAFMRYDAVLAADPDNAPALHYSGVVLFQAGKLPEAAERIRASLAIEPTSPDAWSNLALVLERCGPPRGRRQRAARGSEARADIGRNTREPLGGRARLGTHRRSGSRRRGAPIAADATHAPAWHNLALSLEPQGRLLEAMDAASRATAQAPAEPAYAGFKAQLESTAGMRKKARATLDAALARKPESAPLHFQLAGLLERDGDAVGRHAGVRAMSCASTRSHGAALSQLAVPAPARRRLARPARRCARSFTTASPPARRCCRRSCCCRSHRRGTSSCAAPTRGPRCSRRLPSQRRRRAVARRSPAHRLPVRPTSTRMRPHISRPGCSRRTIGRASRSSRIRRAPTIAVRCASGSCAASTASSMPPAGRRCGSRRRSATTASTSSSISRATPRARAPARARAAPGADPGRITWATRERSAARSSTT